MAIINFDFETYRNMFDGGQKQHMFFINFNFPSDTLGFLSSFVKLPALAKSTSTFGFGSDYLKYPYLVKSTNLPGLTYEEHVVKYGGISYKIAADRTYNDWSITLNIDKKSDVLNKFYDWFGKMYDNMSGTSFPAKFYMVDQEAFLLNGTGDIVSTYKFKYTYPKSIGDVTLDYGSSEIATVDIIFSYAYFIIEQPADQSLNTIAKKFFNKLTGR